MCLKVNLSVRNLCRTAATVATSEGYKILMNAKNSFFKVEYDTESEKYFEQRNHKANKAVISQHIYKLF